MLSTCIYCELACLTVCRVFFCAPWLLCRSRQLASELKDQDFIISYVPGTGRCMYMRGNVDLWIGCNWLALRHVWVPLLFARMPGCHHTKPKRFLHPKPQRWNVLTPPFTIPGSLSIRRRFMPGEWRTPSMNALNKTSWRRLRSMPMRSWSQHARRCSDF